MSRGAGSLTARWEGYPLSCRNRFMVEPKPGRATSSPRGPNNQLVGVGGGGGAVAVRLASEIDGISDRENGRYREGGGSFLVCRTVW